MPQFRDCNHPDLIALLERATRRRVTLVCGPCGIGKTLACSLWAASQLGSLVVWLTLSADDDQSLFWARVYEGLVRASAAAADAIRALADVTALEFPLRLTEAVRSFATPVVIVVDNAHDATSDLVLSGLDLLMRNAPPNLRIVLAGRARPALPQLARLQALGEMTVVGPADLISMTGHDRPAEESRL
jgi:LuxR family transcriptional regulator, maltose regulon positive regulatory protein